MKLIYDSEEPIPPWYPLSLLPPYEISTNRVIRKDVGSIVKQSVTTGGVRVLLKDALTGGRRFYSVEWLWRMSQTEDPVELLGMELSIRRDEVLLRMFAKLLAYYCCNERLDSVKASERIAMLKILSTLLFNKPRPSSPVETRVMSIDTMRKLAGEIREEDDEECEAEYSG